MSGDDDLRVRLGRVRDRGRARRSKPFIAQALAAAERAGGFKRRSARNVSRSTFGRGRTASCEAARRMTDRTRNVAVKARVVRHGRKQTPLRTHLDYLRREGVTKDGAPGRMFDAAHDAADHRAFAERCDGDRHHFRFIVSPEDAEQLSDLKSFTRDLMDQAQRDLGTKLDWIGAEHWNTDNPHVHVIVRGVADDGHDLVISRDYISQGLRARAADLATLELGPRSDLDIRRRLDAEIEADRWTRLDRVLASEAAQHDRIVDLRPEADQPSGDTRSALVGRMRKLERLGLAKELGPARWYLSERIEPILRALGEREDIIKRIHKGLAEQRIERSLSDYVLEEGDPTRPIVGRLIARGLDDELRETTYAVIDGIDGRTHHVRLPNLDATSDGAPGSIVELRRFKDAMGRERSAVAVRSDLSLATQVEATGATWLDRQLVAREPASLSSVGFGLEVQQAIKERAKHLTRENLARREGQRLVFARDLLDTLRRRELDRAGARLAAESGLPYRPAADGRVVSGVYRQRLDLASGRFAMVDDGLQPRAMDAVIGAASEPGGLGACPRRADRMDLRKIARSRNWLNSGRQQASDGAPSDVQRPSDRPTGGAGLPRANLTGFAQFATSPVSMRDSIPSHDDPISVVDSIRLMPFLIVPVAETGDEIEHNQNPSGENSRRLRAGRTEFRASCVQCAGEIVFR